MPYRDSGKPLRTAFYNLWNGQITFGGLPVPVVDEKMDEEMTERDVYISMSTQTETPRPNKGYYAEEARLTALVCKRDRASVDKSIVEDVCDQMTQLVWPGGPREDHGLSIASPFKITAVRKDGSGTIGAKLETGEYVVVKQLNFRVRITQQS